MSDIQEIAAKAALECVWGHEWDHDDAIGEMILDAVEPHLRRKHRRELFDELIAEAEAGVERNEDVYWNQCHRGYGFMAQALKSIAKKEVE